MDAPPESWRRQADRLIAVQQTLLSCGYRYVDGGVESWPMTMVLMANDDGTVLIGPWLLEYAPRLIANWNEFSQQNPRSGLLLVGTAGGESPEIQSFLAAAEGSVAYIDALSLEVTLRAKKTSLLGAPPPLFRNDRIEPLLGPPPSAAARIDARAELERSINAIHEHQDFQVRSAQVGGNRRPIVVQTLMAICIGVFALGVFLQGMHDFLNMQFELYGPPVRDGQWWRIITSGFLHVNGIHILFNMMALYYIGKPLEAFQGQWRMAAYFFFSVIAGSIASLWWDPTVPSVGASGGLFGLIGAMGALILRYRRDFPPVIWQSLKKWIVTILMYNAIFFFVPMINGSAHVGGLIGGFVLALIIARSPTGSRPLTPIAQTALALLLTLTTVFGSYAIRTIPAKDKPQVSRKEQILNDLKNQFFPATEKQPATNPANAANDANDANDENDSR